MGTYHYEAVDQAGRSERGCWRPRASVWRASNCCPEVC